jgi:hypothetical protein
MRAALRRALAYCTALSASPRTYAAGAVLFLSIRPVCCPFFDGAGMVRAGIAGVHLDVTYSN